MIEIKIFRKSKPILCLLDSGSTVSLISKSLVEELDLKMNDSLKEMIKMIGLFGCEYENKFCFIQLAISNSFISFPTLLTSSSNPSLGGADILIGTDVIGPCGLNSRIGLNMPLDGDVELSIYKNSTSKEKLIFKTNSTFGDRRIGFDFSSANQNDFSHIGNENNQYELNRSFRASYEDGNKQSKNLLFNSRLNNEDVQNKENLFEDNLSLNITNNYKNNNSGNIVFSENKSESLLKKFCNPIDLKGFDPTPNTVDLLHRLKSLLTLRDSLVIFKKPNLDNKMPLKGNGSRSKRNSFLNTVKKNAEIEEELESIEKKIAIIQQRLLLKKRKYNRSMKRKERIKNNKIIKKEIIHIPRYSSNQDKVNQPVEATVAFNNDKNNKFIKPFEMDYNIIERSCRTQK